MEKGDWIYLTFTMNSYTGYGNGFKFSDKGKRCILFSVLFSAVRLTLVPVVILSEDQEKIF